MAGSFDDFARRLAELEERQLTLKDLPLAALQRKLEQDWQPDAALLFNEGLLQLGVVHGTATLSWAAGADLSATELVSHGLGATPRRVLALVNGTGGPDLVVVQAFNIGTTTFDMQGGFRTGTWAAGGDIDVAWIAIK